MDKPPVLLCPLPLLKERLCRYFVSESVREMIENYHDDEGKHHVAECRSLTICLCG
ncbi:hypothetical protein [Enterovibrio norvegicus]|uniref:hypothetical protein n=1 Tax=Enterovibrio norvegicus TaxID=188144 RepID=UPI0024B26641|nr:hypothetical protein [Enterovibrio norvegicus]